MGKRKVVPSALHNELSEYASLLRALRTSDTLDLASQLRRATSSVSSSLPEETVSSDEDLGNTLVEPDLPDATATNGDLNKIASFTVANGGQLVDKHQPSSLIKDTTPTSSVIASQNEARKRTQQVVKDNWTRWPLMAGDVPAPEWSLEDEVQVVASRAMGNITVTRPLDQENSSHSVRSTGLDEQDTAAVVNKESADEVSEQDDHDDVPSTALVFAASSYLEQVLAALAAHHPPTTHAMANRLLPANWEIVLSTISAEGLASSETLEAVQRRLEAIYGQPTGNNMAAKRARLVENARQGLGRLVRAHELDFLAYPQPPPDRKKRKGSKKRRKPVSSNDEITQ